MDRQSLSPPNRLATLFNIHPGEGRLVALLVSLYFFLGLAFIITQTVAFALFLDAYGPQSLPYVYIATAIGASLVAFLYLKLVERLPFPMLLTINVSFLLIGSLAFRLGLALPDARWLVFALPIWFQVLVNLGNLAFWALASSLLDVRQGKRLFGLVGSGNWLAVTLGGFVVPPLVAGMGTPNLLLLAAGGLAVALVVVRAIVRAYLHRPVSAPQLSPADKPKHAPGLLRNRYIVLIFVFIFLWWVGFFFVDNIFYDRAVAQYSDANQLASFLGGFFAIVGILALLTTTFLTGPIVDRWGLRGGLLIVPSLVTAGIAALAITGSLGGAAAILFGLAVAAKLVNVALGFALDQPAHTVLYKPLPLSLIGRVTTVGEGIVQPLAIGLAGVSLLLFNTTLALGAVGLSFIFLFVGTAWIVVTIRLIRAYPAALTQALARRQLSELERSRYLEAGALDWDLERRRVVINRIAQSGHKAQTIDLVEGFRHVKLTTLRAGETLIEAGTSASFVYLPLGDGLKIIPLGGYQPFSVKAWMPLGSTGVIRGAVRNANVVTDRDVSLLIIPKEVYLQHWHDPYTAAELQQVLAPSDDHERIGTA